MEKSELHHLALIIKNISYAKYLHMLNDFKTLDGFFSLSQNEVNSYCKKLKLSETFNIQNMLGEAEKLEQTFQKDKVVFRSLAHEKYPKRLKQVYAPPLGLFFRGNITGFDEYSESGDKCNVAIVGTRKSRDFTCSITEKIAGDLALQGINIISGFASGIDAAAHRGALYKKSMTTAVFGSGVKHLFPRSNVRLLRTLYDEGGIVLSEYLPDAPPMTYYFPQRNRIISGLSDAVVMMEAKEKSGALITVKHAIEQDRDVFIYHPNEQSEYFTGNMAYIAQGATAIHSANDIIRHLYGDKHPVVKEEEKDDDMFRFLTNGPISLVDLAKAMNKTPDEMLTLMAPYILSNTVIETGGNKYYKAP